MSLPYSSAIPPDFEPPVSIPDVFTYSIRGHPYCIPFHPPGTQVVGVSPSTGNRETKKNNKSTKQTRMFYKWVKDNNITETGHRNILPWGLTVEEFLIIVIWMQYEKRDQGKKRK